MIDDKLRGIVEKFNTYLGTSDIDELLSAIKSVLLEALPKEKEFSPVDWGDGIIMNECTDATFSIERAKGFNQCLSEITAILKGEKK